MTWHSAVFHKSGLEKHVRFYCLMDMSVMYGERQSKCDYINIFWSECNIAAIKKKGRFVNHSKHKCPLKRPKDK